jgi:hypothetical protein
MRSQPEGAWVKRAIGGEKAVEVVHLVLEQFGEISSRRHRAGASRQISIPNLHLVMAPNSHEQIWKGEAVIP